MYFSRLKVGYPDPLKVPPDWEGCWRIYSIRSPRMDSPCQARLDIVPMDHIDKENARKTLVSLTEKAHTGMPFAELYDEKQCHVAHTFVMQPQKIEVKIWRVWGSGKIRVYFCYAPSKSIVVLKIAPKRVGTLSKGEKSELEDIATAVMNYIDAGQFQARIV